MESAGNHRGEGGPLERTARSPTFAWVNDLKRRLWLEPARNPGIIGRSIGPQREREGKP